MIWPAPAAREKQTVGAARETDSEIIRCLWGMYTRLKMKRIYFSAYQPGRGAADCPGETDMRPGPARLLREHRLYQVDFLVRKYGFTGDEIPFGTDGNLSLELDPKLAWARAHPEHFPVRVNRASRSELLRVPGLGPTTVTRILRERATAHLYNGDRVGLRGKRWELTRQWTVWE